MGSEGGSYQSGTSTVVVKALPGYAKKYAKRYLNKSRAVMKSVSDTDYFGHGDSTVKTYADQEPNEKLSLSSLASLSKSRHQTGGLLYDVEQFLGDVLDGNWLQGSKSVFTDMVSNAQNDVSSQFNTNIEPLLGGSLILMGDDSSPNLAKSLVVNSTSRYMDRESARMYAENYDIERESQDMALSAGVPVANEYLVSGELLRMSGVWQREYEQGKLEDKYRKWYEKQELKRRRIEILGNAIRSLVGAQTTTTSPFYRPTQGTNIAGGAMSGAAVGAHFGPWGALLGGVAGGVLGSL